MNKLSIESKLKINQSSGSDNAYLELVETTIPEGFRTVYSTSDDDMVSILRNTLRFSSDVTDDQIRTRLNEINIRLQVINISDIDFSQQPGSILNVFPRLAGYCAIKYKLPGTIRGYLGMMTEVINEKIDQYQGLTSEQKQTLRQFFLLRLPFAYEAENSTSILLPSPDSSVSVGVINSADKITDFIVRQSIAKYVLQELNPSTGIGSITGFLARVFDDKLMSVRDLNPSSVFDETITNAAETVFTDTMEDYPEFENYAQMFTCMGIGFNESKIQAVLLNMVPERE